MNTMNTETLYFRFLQMVQSVNTLPVGVVLSPVEALLLEEIFLKEQAHQPLTVTEAIELKHLASPSTLHRKLIRIYVRCMTLCMKCSVLKPLPN